MHSLTKNNIFSINGNTVVTVNIGEEELRKINNKIGKNRLYPSRSELVRVAIKQYLQKEIELLKTTVMVRIKENNDKESIQVPTLKTNEVIAGSTVYKILRRMEY